MAFYSYREGGRFEPDFVLILQRQTEGRREQIQVLFEPKGDQLLEEDAWKEDFLLEIGTDTVRQVLEDGTVLRWWAFPSTTGKSGGWNSAKGWSGCSIWMRKRSDPHKARIETVRRGCRNPSAAPPVLC